MKPRLLALFLLPAAVMAQADPEIPSNLFFDTDLVPIIPKWTMGYGIRGLTGASSTFGGTGFVTSVQGQGVFTDHAVNRQYHDGHVSIPGSGRTAQIDDGAGHIISVPVTPDGTTDTWSYSSASQAQPDDGTMAFHTYAAAIADSGGRSKKSDPGYGIEVSFKRDTGMVFKGFSFDVLGGISLNPINSKFATKETAAITTVTDTFSLNGQDAPAAPYTAPSFSSVSQVDASGHTAVDADGNSQIVNRDTTVPLAQDPSDRTTATATDSTSVTNDYHLKGAFFTLRAGPSVSVPLGNRFRATLSAGAALVYAGTTYTVEQQFTPSTGDLIVSTVERSEVNFLPGLYADANIEMTFTERAGGFFGVAYQNNGSFDQTIKDGQVNYATKVKLNNLAGIRMGLNVRF